jgi:hypothetical protein
VLSSTVTCHKLSFGKSILVFPILNAWLCNQALQFCNNIKTYLRLQESNGIILIGFVAENRMQRGLFDNTEREKAARLMQAIDVINAKVGSPVRWAVEGINQPWQVKFKRRSNRYTTRWDELPVVV